MGWNSGSQLFEEIIKNVQANVADAEVRKSIYLPLIEVFRNEDWDTYDECLGEDPAYDAALRASIGEKRWKEYYETEEDDDD